MPLPRIYPLAWTRTNQIIGSHLCRGSDRVRRGLGKGEAIASVEKWGMLVQRDTTLEQVLGIRHGGGEYVVGI